MHCGHRAARVTHAGYDSSLAEFVASASGSRKLVTLQTQSPFFVFVRGSPFHASQPRTVVEQAMRQSRTRAEKGPPERGNTAPSLLLATATRWALEKRNGAEEVTDVLGAPRGSFAVALSLTQPPSVHVRDRRGCTVEPSRTTQQVHNEVRLLSHK